MCLQMQLWAYEEREGERVGGRAPEEESVVSTTSASSRGIRIKRLSIQHSLFPCGSSDVGGRAPEELSVVRSRERVREREREKERERDRKTERDREGECERARNREREREKERET